MTLLDAETIESLRALQTPKDPNFLMDFLKALLNPMSKRLEDMRSAIANNDSKKLEEVAHAMKSGVLNVGALPIAEISGQLEKLGKNGTVVGARDLYLKLIPLCESLEKEVHSLPEFKQAA